MENKAAIPASKECVFMAPELDENEIKYTQPGDIYNVLTINNIEFFILPCEIFGVSRCGKFYNTQTNKFMIPVKQKRTEKKHVNYIYILKRKLGDKMCVRSASLMYAQAFIEKPRIDEDNKKLVTTYKNIEDSTSFDPAMINWAIIEKR